MALERTYLSKPLKWPMVLMTPAQAASASSFGAWPPMTAYFALAAGARNGGISARNRSSCSTRSAGCVCR